MTPIRLDMQRLNEFFDHVYVVTIERNAERRALLDEDLRGLDFSYLMGVDGRQLSESEVRACYDDAAAIEKYGRSLSRGQLGCALSHRRVYEDVLEKGFERVLVLEDDAVSCRSRFSAIHLILGQLPVDWDFLYLFTYRPEESRLLDLKIRFIYPMLTSLRIKRYELEQIRTMHSRPYTPNLRFAGQHWSALAYAVTRSTAARMLDYQTPVRTVADDVTRMVCASPGIKAFLAVPNLFKPRPDTASSIWNRPPRADRVMSRAAHTT